MILKIFYNIFGLALNQNQTCYHFAKLID